MSRRLPTGLVVLLAAAMLVGCSPVLETDQARLCRMALPALMPEGARIAIEAQTPDPDERGLSVAFTAQTPGETPQHHLAACRFREPGRPRESRDLTSLTLDGSPSRKPGSTFWSAIGWRRRRAAPRIPRPSAT